MSTSLMDFINDNLYIVRISKQKNCLLCMIFLGGMIVLFINGKFLSHVYLHISVTNISSKFFII